MARGRRALQVNSLSREELNKRIQLKAYEIWQKKGCRPGDEWADWFEAEKSVTSDRG